MCPRTTGARDNILVSCPQDAPNLKGEICVLFLSSLVLQPHKYLLSFLSQTCELPQLHQTAVSVGRQSATENKMRKCYNYNQTASLKTRAWLWCNYEAAVYIYYPRKLTGFYLVVNDIFKCVDRFWQHAKINEHILGHEWIMIPGTVNILNQV